MPHAARILPSRSRHRFTLSLGLALTGSELRVGVADLFSTLRHPHSDSPSVRCAPTVMFFVVARKMLIKTESFVDLLMGVVALGGLFGIRMFLFRRAPVPQLGEVTEPQ